MHLEFERFLLALDHDLGEWVERCLVRLNIVYTALLHYSDSPVQASSVDSLISHLMLLMHNPNSHT